MICPLRKTMNTTIPGELTFTQDDCLKEGCAWWEPKIGKCAVLRMWIALQDIHEVLHDIADKMPQEDKP